MSIVSDIAGDWTHIEGVEEVTFTPQNPAAAAITAVKALRRELSRNTQFGGPAGIEPRDIPFHLWRYGAAGVEKLTDVKPGDKITDADTVAYRVITVSFSPRTSRYRCVCRREAS